eukprot:TRINITY_DN11124_c0_g1_i3.p1 TRINITY_DN11124_c0_g1~~TRINITY_DN11124_c0_g1_i3.p1  ORF type:complete len:196 (+),score=42.65 TRINITY_DN11124_c0_g1_i3:62-649(+)
MSKLTGKVALVTGASKGIGKAIAIELAHLGADVVVNYRTDEGGAEDTKKAIEGMGRKVVSIQSDVGNMKEVQQLFDEAQQVFPEIHILVNNAGISRKNSFLNVTEEEYNRVLDVDLKSTFFLSQHFAQHRKAVSEHRPDRKDNGSIITISSVHEEIPLKNNVTYCLAKAALKMFTRCVALELAPFGIRVAFHLRY